MIGNTLRRLSRRLGWQPHTRGDRQTLKDRALARRLRDTFEQDLEVADVQGLHFYVQDGIVTVYGTVRHDLDRELLLSFVRQVPGVEDVVAHLQTLEQPSGADNG